MSWISAVFLFFALEGTTLALAQTAAVNLFLEPPATSTNGVLSYDYCPTALVSVNVTCTVEGIELPLRILPQVVIGTDHFYPNNGAKLAKWGITVFFQSDTLLRFALPLTEATNGLSIHCQSENYSSPSIILLSDIRLCVAPTPAIPPSTSDLSTDVDLFSTPSSSIDETLSTPLPLPSGQPRVTPHLPGAIAGTVITFVLLVIAVVIVSVSVCCCFLRRNNASAELDLVRTIPTRSEQELTGMDDSGRGTLEPHNQSLSHQGSAEVDQETNGNS